MSKVTVEIVESQYVLNSKGFEDGAKKVAAASADADKAVKKSGASAHSSGGMLKRLGEGAQLVTGTIGAAVGAVAAIAVPLVLGGKAALETATQFDTLQRSLTAITGSGERTGQILSFIDKLAIPSVFDTATLGESAKLLEAFGLSTERFLPIAEKLGTVFGGNAESLNSFVSALGYIKSGRFGEGFESLARGGISREALAAQGLKFDKGGSFQGTVDQALTAIEVVVNAKFGKLAEEMASGPMAKLASLGDSFNRVMRSIGLALVEPVVAISTTLAGAFENLNAVNVFGEAMKSFMGSIQGIGLVSIDAEETLLNLAGAFVAFGVFLKKFSEGFVIAKDNFIAVVRAIPIVGQLITVAETLIDKTGLGNNLGEAYGGGEAERFIAGKRFDLEQRRKRLAEQAAAGENLGKTAEAPTGVATPGESVKDLLKNIADSSAGTNDNTKKMADINDRVLGGGGLASRGLSREEMQGLAGRRRSGTQEIKSLLVELGYAIERNMVNVSAKNIGYNVSRREV
jgi:hypothetical protein